jgi:prevent-host-death family protein
MDKRKTYSTYEAKARLSEILRAVRERGESALISYRGEPIAEIRPVETPDTGLAGRVEHLERAGVVVRGSRRGSLKPLATRAGALERFLAERSE